MGGLGAVFIGANGSKYRVTDASTNSKWFRRFMLDCHRRMGDTIRPDKAISKYVIRDFFIWGN